MKFERIVFYKTPLYIAVEKGFTEIVALLLSRGVDVNKLLIQICFFHSILYNCINTISSINLNKISNRMILM